MLCTEVPLRQGRGFSIRVSPNSSSSSSSISTFRCVLSLFCLCLGKVGRLICVCVCVCVCVCGWMDGWVCSWGGKWVGERVRARVR